MIGQPAQLLIREVGEVWNVTEFFDQFSVHSADEILSVIERIRNYCRDPALATVPSPEQRKAWDELDLSVTLHCEIIFC
jgi:hypothetical protein